MTERVKTNALPIQAGSSQHGLALSVALHVVLLLCVLCQVVYLASRYRIRIDMTSDKMWTTTDSTRTLIDKLDKRLVIEAYFSPKEALPVDYRAARAWADNFLDEVVQLGKGKVVLQRFDPNADKAIADKATRLGIQPQRLPSQSTTSLSIDQHWQGLRLVYGGGKQELISQFVPVSSFMAEAIVVPKIKEVMTAKRRTFGYMEWPASAVGGRNPAGIGWNIVRTHEGIKKRYEFQNVKSEDGVLLPDDLEMLFLFRPKDLTDRQKYVIDQFVVGGGTLVVFADAAEYTIGRKRSFTKIPLVFDASGSEHQFLRQLEHYGINWRPQVLADMAVQAHMPRDRFREAYEYLAVPMQGVGRQVSVPYPYFFHPVNVDWAEMSDQLAVDSTGKLDEQLAQRFRDTFVPGMPSDAFLFQVFKKINRGPGFYWPTWVGLRQRAGGKLDLPSGIEGRVLLWSSPAMLVEDPPQSLNPLGSDPRQMRSQIDKFTAQLADRLKAEPSMQAPLMCEISGKFASYFAGMERPQRASEIKEAAARRKAEERAAEAGGEQQPEPVDPDEVGPQPAKADAKVVADTAPQEREMLMAGERPGRIVMVGDATFLRDDLLRPDYQRIGGPWSAKLAMPFFAQMLDWLAEDEDLVALQTRAPADRTVTLLDVETRPGDPRTAEQNLRRKTFWLVWLNVLLPCGLLAAFGLILFMVRRGHKRAFLASLG